MGISLVGHSTTRGESQYFNASPCTILMYFNAHKLSDSDHKNVIEKSRGQNDFL